jgi:hypothetical protein
MEPKLYVRERDAVRAAKKAGHLKADIVTFQSGERFGWRLAGADEFVADTNHLSLEDVKAFEKADPALHEAAEAALAAIRSDKVTQEMQDALGTFPAPDAPKPTPKKRGRKPVLVKKEARKAKASPAPNAPRASRFSFTAVGLKTGTVVYSTLKKGEHATVDGERHVLFRGVRHTLSGAAMILATEKGKKWPRIQGPLYWTHNDKKLADLR